MLTLLYSSSQPFQVKRVASVPPSSGRDAWLPAALNQELARSGKLAPRWQLESCNARVLVDTAVHDSTAVS